MMNLFKGSNGKAVKTFVSEMSRLFEAFNEDSGLESIAMKASSVLPMLLLLRPFRNSKTKEHAHCLLGEKTLKSWIEGDLNELPSEGRAIQHRIPKFHSSVSYEHLARVFAWLMFPGGVYEPSAQQTTPLAPEVLLLFFRSVNELGTASYDSRHARRGLFLYANFCVVTCKTPKLQAH